MIKNIIGYCSRQFQVNLEDSGTTLSTTTNPSINDEKCNQACIFLFSKSRCNRGYCSLCEVAAPVRRVTVRGLCELSMFDRCSPYLLPYSIILFQLSILFFLSAGFTITSSTRRGSQCLSGATPPFSSTTDPSAPGSGTDNIRNYENINISTMLCFHRRSNPARYDRKDPGVVAISLSPEASLLLGFKRSFFLLIFEVPKDHYHHPTHSPTF